SSARRGGRRGPRGLPCPVTCRRGSPPPRPCSGAPPGRRPAGAGSTAARSRRAHAAGPRRTRSPRAVAGPPLRGRARSYLARRERLRRRAGHLLLGLDRRAHLRDGLGDRHAVLLGAVPVAEGDGVVAAVLLAGDEGDGHLGLARVDDLLREEVFALVQLITV